MQGSTATLPPYSLMGLVILLSLLLAGYELFKIFDRDFGRALRNRYALLVGVLNVITAVAVWLILHNVMRIQPTILSALVTGLTFPLLLRSRFTLYRSIGPTETDEMNEVSLKMDEIYQSLQRAFYREVNLQLTQDRLALSQRIRQVFSASVLANYLEEFIETETLEQERTKHQGQLDKILAIEDNRKRHRQLANMLIDLKTRADLKKAIRAKSLISPTNRDENDHG